MSHNKKDYSAWWYLLPATLVLLIFHILPVIYSFLLSVHRGTLKHPIQHFIGAQNYLDLLEDSGFWEAMINTVFFALGSVPLGMFFALLVALLLNQKIKGLGIYRTVYYLPVITSIAAVALVWNWLFDVKFGLFNQLLKSFGMSPSQWLLEPRGIFESMAQAMGFGLPDLLHGPSVALCSIIVMSIWKGLGYNVVIFLAGLQNIPPSLYEAADLDGASVWQKFKHITWPLLSPTTFFIFIMSTIHSFQVFVQIFMMTPFGGPERSTVVAVFYLYEKAFKTFEFGYASALAYVVFLIIFILTLLQRRYVGERVHYGG
jgi:multiple sugar transport system permease protein